ncbi:MAG: hypothetical protein K0R82_1065 [Flavipsychrobacter sp.]|jgi:hypothetical protein|nr:hypothetical protein [Flavipsychrobacter sp.]
MIDVSLNFIKRILNTQIDARTTAGPEVELSSLPKDPDTNSKDQIFITLFNVEQDKTFRNLPVYSVDPGNSTKLNLKNAEITLNLWVLFTAQFKKDNYESALKFISLLITIFQGKNVYEDVDFTAAEKTAGLEKIILELNSPNFDQSNQVWQTMGSKMVPFVLYKVRMIAILDKEAPIIRSSSIVQGIDLSLSNK